MLNVYLHSLILFLFSCVFIPELLYANSIEVCNSCEKSSIKSAISATNSLDTIFVLDGVYFEDNIDINHPLIILGKSDAIIDGNGNSIFKIKFLQFSEFFFILF